MAQAATSPQLLRRVNADAVLAVLRRSAVVTVTDLMVATGLTRATVLAVCEDLIEAGWVLELANMRDSGGDYTKGRPARRFCYHTRAGVVIGVDLGLVTATVVVPLAVNRNQSTSARVEISPEVVPGWMSTAEARPSATSSVIGVGPLLLMMKRSSSGLFAPVYSPRDHWLSGL